MIRAIVGANWGDEGKGKMTDLFAAQSDVVVRFQGGANAGHTILNPYGRFALHQLPSGVFYDHVANVIGNGVALSIPSLMGELERLEQAGVPAPKLLISDRVQIVMPYHVLFDQYEEERLSNRQFGSTRSGIAPFYADKHAKTGIQISELYDEPSLREKVRGLVAVKNVLLEHLYQKAPIDADELMAQLHAWGEWVRPYLADTFSFLREAMGQGRNILLEGQLGALKDPDFGIYPFVTSTSTLAGFATVGAGIPPTAFSEIIAVTKAYSSAVGAGAFVSEIFGAPAEELRRRGGDAGEYGATTGRPRRIGWFDTVATRYGCRVQGATSVALTGLDVLSYLDEIPVCTAYEADGKITRDFPVTPTLSRAKPVFTRLPGWRTNIRGLASYSDLPQQARDYVRFIEEEIGFPIRYLSTGPKREEIIWR